MARPEDDPNGFGCAIVLLWMAWWALLLGVCIQHPDFLHDLWTAIRGAK